MALGPIVSPARGEDRFLFLPSSPLFAPLLADPREPHHGIVAYLNQNHYEGNLGETIEFLQWHPQGGSPWAWGIVGASDILLDSRGFGVFPERVSDWYLGTYLSESSGDFSGRFEYLHVSSHLGDGLFNKYQHFIYTRESFRLTGSYRFSDQLRLYAGAGYWGHIAPPEDPFFLQAGLEAATGYSRLIGTVLRGYFAYDLKVKNEAGGVVNQAFQAGVQWKWKKTASPGIRMAVLYFNGNTEFGQFYRLPDDHWGLGIYFDP